MLEVRVLGPLAVVADGTEIALSAAKLRRLLAALVVSAGAPRSVDWLIGAMWDAAPPPSAEKLVQVYVSQLRKLLPAGLAITTGTTGYSLEPAGWQLDARRFEQLLAESRRDCAENPRLALSALGHALDMWRGTAYGAFATADFARPEAERLEELRRQAAAERNELELQFGRHAVVLPDIRAAAEANPLHERLQGQLMLALYRTGQQAAALEHYRCVRQRLIDELGIEPGDELQRLHSRMLRHDLALEAVQPPPVAGNAQAELPTAPNALRGRDHELADLHALLREPDVRLVVLTGAGGSGKTRLAIEAGHRAAAEFADGVRFVSLAAVREADALAAAIAEALDVPRAAGQPLDALIAHLRHREMLLILDNFEQLRAAAPLLVSLVAGAPRLTALVTSRVVLHVSGEHVFPVDPLSGDAAAALFGERAATASVRLRHEQLERGTIDTLCQRLDRLPLAIELAAGHLRALTPEELLARLETRLPLLVGGPADLPSRQQTLRATLAWSYDQLEPQAQRDLAALSVFAEGCTLDAVAVVLGSGEQTPRRLLELVDHSLLTHTATAHGSRYVMLETVREFAAEQLAASGEQDLVRRRHAEYLVRFAESLGLSIDALAAGRPKRNDLAAAEQANVRAALDWAEEADPELGLALMAALEQFWIATNPTEAAARLTALLDRAVDAPVDVRARALRDLGGAVEFVGDQPRALDSYRTSLELYRQLADENNELQLVHRLVQQALLSGEIDEARRLLADALPRAETGGHRFAECQLRLAAGWLQLVCGNYPAAYDEEMTALRLMRQIGQWPWGETGPVRTLAEVCSAMGRHDEAMAYAREALALITPVGDRLKTVRTLASLALVQLRAGEEQSAGLLWGGIEAEEQRSFLGQWADHRAVYAAELDGCRSDTFECARKLGQRRALAELIAEQLSA